MKIAIQRKPGFSLTELVVAVGLLVVMISLAGTVMSITVQSTGQARSLSEINQSLRMLEQSLRDDLRSVKKGQSLLFIQGNPIHAYWTASGRDADNDKIALNGYPHPDQPDLAAPGNPDSLSFPRADILMFFSSRKATSSISPPMMGGAMPTPISSQMQQVVYGHADLGEWVMQPSGPAVFKPYPAAFPDNPDALSPAVAENWHLSRRSILLVPGESPTHPITGVPLWANSPGLSPGEPVPLGAVEILQSEIDIVANYDYAEQVLTPNLFSPAGQYPLNLPFMFDPAPGGWSRPFARSRLDVSAPIRLASRMGHYFLPNCASFQVEWTLEPGGELVGNRFEKDTEAYWFDPGALPLTPGASAKPLSALEKAMLEADDLANRSTSVWEQKRALQLREVYEGLLGGPAEYSLLNRFSDDPNWRISAYGVADRTNTVVFTGSRQPNATSGLDELVPDPAFPSALRITVDVFDTAKRLGKPIRHVMVIPVG